MTTNPSEANDLEAEVRGYFDTNTPENTIAAVLAALRQQRERAQFKANLTEEVTRLNAELRTERMLHHNTEQQAQRLAAQLAEIREHMDRYHSDCWTAEQGRDLERQLAEAKAKANNLDSFCPRCQVAWLRVNYGMCPVCVMDIANDGISEENRRIPAQADALGELRARLATLEAALAKVDPVLVKVFDVLTTAMLKFHSTGQVAYKADCREARHQVTELRADLREALAATGDAKAVGGDS